MRDKKLSFRSTHNVQDSKNKTEIFIHQVKNYVKHYVASTELCDSDYSNVGSVIEKYGGVGGSTMGLMEKERIKLRLENGKILKQWD